MPVEIHIEEATEQTVRSFKSVLTEMMAEALNDTVLDRRTATDDLKTALQHEGFSPAQIEAAGDEAIAAFRVGPDRVMV